MNSWTKEEIKHILFQLDQRNLPFRGHSLFIDNELKMLGQGGYAFVYEAQTRFTKKSKYAIKVIGFRGRSDSKVFYDSMEVQNTISYGYEISQNIVKVYGYKELWITVDENEDIISVVREKPEEITSRTFSLQFVLMEKLECVIKRTRAGNLEMMPKTLKIADEKEVLKFAYEIGKALKSVHSKDILHRDVKLENVFWDSKHKKYKLGDFGIAKQTKDGFANTIAFTDGYMAPEISKGDGGYDCTADIYSFGIMLYILMNHLKFPGSNTYNVNVSEQYMPGYIVPCPDSGISQEFYQIIAKACMYEVEERYQSIDEILKDIEKIICQKKEYHKRNHKYESITMAYILGIIGSMLMKSIYMPDLEVKISFAGYAILLLGLYKLIQKIRKYEVMNISIWILFLGCYVIYKNSFAWEVVVFIVAMGFSKGYGAGYISSVILGFKYIYSVQFAGADLSMFYSYGWLAISFISMSVLFLQLHSLSEQKSYWSLKRHLVHKNIYLWVFILFNCAVVWDVKMKIPYLNEMIMDLSSGYLKPNEIILGCATNIVVCIFLLIREEILIKRETNFSKGNVS